MREPGSWARLYAKDLEYLFPLTDHVYSWLLQDLPKVEKHFTKHDIPLATLLAGPFMALFATIIDFDSAMHVLDRFILLKQDALLSIIKNVFKISQEMILRFTHTGML
jgi:hypothetical protein